MHEAFAIGAVCFTRFQKRKVTNMVKSEIIKEEELRLKKREEEREGK